jgi:hypothetical protein
MSLTMFTGHSVTDDVQDVPGDRISFRAADGSTLFEVRSGKDGKSLEIRANDCCKVGGVLYSTRLMILPHVTNCVTVTVQEYDK